MTPAAKQPKVAALRIVIRPFGEKVLEIPA
jgi:hypothetical protein